MNEHAVRIQSLGHSEYRLTTQVEIPRSRSEVFEFFANAHNLEKITPTFLNFRILTPAPIEMSVGAKIDYQIRLHGIPIRWRTNICVWQPEDRFADEQIRGPYRRWHHEHQFVDLGRSTLMKDIVDYRIWLGRIVHPLLVGKDLKKIFEYRTRRILQIFSDSPASGHQSDFDATAI